VLTGGELELDGKQGGSSQAGRQVAACRQQHNSRPQHLVFLWDCVKEKWLIRRSAGPFYPLSCWSE